MGRSTFITEPDPRAVPCSRVSSCGFTLMEVLVGIVVTLILLLTLAPVWTGLEKRSVSNNDRMIGLLQSRVAAARLDRDLRLASGTGCGGILGSPLLKREWYELVLVTREAEGATPEIVEWEFAQGALMRRRGPWPGYLPGSITHSLYTDHKTMLEGVADGAFSYYAAGLELESCGVQAELDPTDKVLVRGRLVCGQNDSITLNFAWQAAVGR